ncbi:hypothetical protein EV122DRAFT_269454 [Schizophyllum commune]
MTTPYHALRGVSTKEWSFDDIVASSDNFHPVKRVRYDSDLTLALDEYKKSDIPLIIEGWHVSDAWDHELLSLNWFAKHAGLPGDRIDVRNVHTWTDDSIPLHEFIAKSRSIGPAVVEGEGERLYGKDAICPAAWSDWLHNCSDIPRQVLPDDQSNILNALPESSRVEHLMCYLGVGDTFTPMHKDLCASYGHNLMTYTENGGSSYWFMTRGRDAQQVAEYFHDLQQELDHENYVISLEELRRAPFPVYIVEQKVGDMVFVPPRSAHQVVNSGGITVKTSWSRMEFGSLGVALFNELPIYRRVCRRETYKVKSLVHHFLLRTAQLLEDQLETDKADETVVRRLFSLIELYDHILVDEHTESHATMTHLTTSLNGDAGPSTSRTTAIDFPVLVCDFCGADIFQSYFRCSTCARPPSEAETLEDVCICAGCYVEGRTCLCENMEPMQYRQFTTLLDLRKRARSVLASFSQRYGYPSGSSMFEDEKSMLLKKRDATFNSATTICDLRRNPPKKPTRMCRPTGCSPSHQVPFLAALKCRQCHSFHCFRHTLDVCNIHVTSALAVCYSRPDEWHDYHVDGREQQEQRRANFYDAQGKGQPPRSLDAMRAAVASIFHECRPLRPSSVKLGFYDTVDESSSSTAGSTDYTSSSGERDSEHQRPRKRRRKSKSSHPDDALDNWRSECSDSSARQPQQKSHTRVLDCVLLTPWSTLSKGKQPAHAPRISIPTRAPQPSALATASSKPMFAPFRYQHSPPIPLPAKILSSKRDTSTRVPASVFHASQRQKRSATDLTPLPAKRPRQTPRGEHPTDAVLVQKRRSSGPKPVQKTQARPRNLPSQPLIDESVVQIRRTTVPAGLRFKKKSAAPPLLENATSEDTIPGLASDVTVPAPDEGSTVQGRPLPSHLPGPTAPSTHSPSPPLPHPTLADALNACNENNYSQTRRPTPSRPSVQEGMNSSTSGHIPQSNPSTNPAAMVPTIFYPYGMVVMPIALYEHFVHRLQRLEEHNGLPPMQIPPLAQPGGHWAWPPGPNPWSAGPSNPGQSR